jgi:hypothetical protein
MCKGWVWESLWECGVSIYNRSPLDSSLDGIDIVYISFDYFNALSSESFTCRLGRISSNTSDLPSAIFEEDVCDRRALWATG